MISTWTRHAVADLIDKNLLYIGDGYRAKNSELADHGLPFARGGNIDAGFDFEKADRFPTSDLDRVGMKVSQSGDVVFTSKGTVGRFAFVRNGTEKFVYSPQLSFWRSLNAEVIDHRFLYYWMHGREFFLQYSGAKGQTDMADYVSLRDQRRMYITLPPLPEQRAIAHVLGTLDDKIELNRRMNTTLEALARAIFKSWFVDFDPVHAKARGEQPVGMDAATAALFPDHFEDSDLGPIPAGWEVMPLPDAIEVNPKRNLRKAEVAPYLEMSNLPTFYARPLGWEWRAFGSGMRFQNGDILLARITPSLENGKTVYVDFLEDGQIGWGSTEYIVFRSKDPLPNEYAYFLARTNEFRNYAIQNMTGTSGRQRVPASCFDDYLIVVPPEQVAQTFGRLINSFMIKLKLNDEESATLASTRNMLLPKLMSGEVRVGELEPQYGKGPH